MRHHALFGLQLAAGQLPERRKLGHCFEHKRRSFGFSHYSLRSCSLNMGGRGPLSNRRDVRHGGFVAQSNSMLRVQIGSTTSGHLVHTACVTQSPGLRGKKCKYSFRMLTWGNWHAEDVSVFAMVGSKDKSKAAHGMGSGAQPLLGSTLCRCVRRWLQSCGWKSALCHNATVPAWHAHNALRPGQAGVGSLAVALLLGHTHSCS